MKIYIFNLMCIMILVSISIISCVKEENTNSPIDGTTYESLEIIKTTINGIIVDENGTPISDAFIKIDNAQTDAFTNTDENGYYELFDVDVKGRVANISINATNMFDSEFKVFVSKGSVSKADFKINNYTSIGSFQSSESTALSSTDGVLLEFTENSIVTSSGSEYSGMVEVFVAKLDPLKNGAKDYAFGGNVGESSILERGAVYQYQTIQVELKSSSGDLLNIKEGKTAKISIAADNGAPSGLDNNDLVMMYYDETGNIWKEEKRGEFTGNSWVAELPHFSTWSFCYIRANSIEGSGHLILVDGSEAYFATTYVLLDYGDTRFASATAYDGSFFFQYGLLDHPFTLRVLNSCQEEIFSEDFTTVPTEGDFGAITIDTPDNDSKKLSVSVFNCDDTPVASGYSRFCIKGFDYNRCQVIPIEGGLVEYDFWSCTNGLEGYLYLLNTETFMTTDPIKVNLNDSDVIIDYVTLCDTFKNNLTVNINGSLFYTNRRVTYGGTIGDNDKKTNILGSDNTSASISFGILGPFDNPDSYVFENIFISSQDGTIYIRDLSPDMTFELEEFEPDLTAPDNFLLYPEHLKASFSGTVEYHDPITDEVLGTYTIDGTVLID